MLRLTKYINTFNRSTHCSKIKQNNKRYKKRKAYYNYFKTIQLIHGGSRIIVNLEFIGGLLTMGANP